MVSDEDKQKIRAMSVDELIAQLGEAQNGLDDRVESTKNTLSVLKKQKEKIDEDIENL